MYLGRLSLPTQISESAWVLQRKKDVHKAIRGTQRAFLSRITGFGPGYRHQEREFTRKFTHPLNDPPRSLTTTLAPRVPKNTAYAFPNPPPEPVTTTVCPSNLNSDMMIRREGNVEWKEEGRVISRKKIQRPSCPSSLGTEFNVNI